jgi:hypothetical protein
MPRPSRNPRQQERTLLEADALAGQWLRRAEIAERENEKLRTLLGRIHTVTAHAGLPLGQRIHEIITSSGLLGDS